jgi:Fur family transcriptional regulator, ferric uptake regulator
MTPSHFQRNTPQRRVILEELQRMASHPTAIELYEVVRRRLPKVSLGTVYRNLDLLAQAGAIRRLDFSGAEARFDGSVTPHDHIRCLRCGRLDDIGTVPLAQSSRFANDFRGYKVLGHRLEFIGICPRCQAQPDDQPQGE